MCWECDTSVLLTVQYTLHAVYSNDTQMKWELAKLMVNQHNYITGMKPCVLAAMDKTSALQTLLKMHHTEAGEHRESYMDMRFSSGSWGRADINWVIHWPSCIKTQPASSSSLQQNIPRDQHASLCSASSTDHSIANYWLLTAKNT